MRTFQGPRVAVGWIGLGNMGTAMAERVLDAGFPLTVYNRTPGKTDALATRGAELAPSVAELVEGADAVFTSLADDDALEAVATEVVEASRPGTVLADTSTVSPAVSARVASLAESASVDYLRAPVSGNPTVVRAGNLRFIVSGKRETLERVEPVLGAIAAAIHYVGDGEQARIVKLATNLMIAGLGELMSEALVLAEASGVSRSDMLDVMEDSAVGAPFVKYKKEPLIRDDFSATFTTTLMEKDIDLVLDVAEQEGVELPIAREMKTLLRATAEAGYADDDFIALFLRLRSASLDQEVVR